MYIYIFRYCDRCKCSAPTKKEECSVCGARLAGDFKIPVKTEDIPIVTSIKAKETASGFISEAELNLLLGL